MICEHCGGRMSPLPFSDMSRCKDCGAEAFTNDYEPDELDWSDTAW